MASTRSSPDTVFHGTQGGPLLVKRHQGLEHGTSRTSRRAILDQCAADVPPTNGTLSRVAPRQWARPEALAVGVAGPLGPEWAVGGIGSIRSSRRALPPMAARKAGVSERQPQGRCRPHIPGETSTAHRPQRQLNAPADKSHSAGVEISANVSAIDG
jgi:hypothetical protein